MKHINKYSEFILELRRIVSDSSSTGRTKSIDWVYNDDTEDPKSSGAGILLKQDLKDREFQDMIDILGTNTPEYIIKDLINNSKNPKRINSFMITMNNLKFLKDKQKEVGDLYCEYCNKGPLVIYDINPANITSKNIDDPNYRLNTKFDPKDAATADHKIPRSKGGDKLNYTNLAVCCNRCNQLKGNMSYEDWMIKLLKKEGKNYKVSYWTKEKCKEEALKYKTRNEFIKKNRPSYRVSNKNGWLDEICSHMISPYKLNYWTKETCKIDALKYTTRREFLIKSKVAYNKSLKNGWLDEICSHMKRVGNRFKRCIYAAEFSDNKVYIGLTYNLERRTYQHLVNDKTSNIYKYIKLTGLTPIIKQLTDYIDVEDASKMEVTKIEEYIKNGWEILNQVRGGNIGGDTIKWTKEVCQKEALKYNTRNQFKLKSPLAYHASRRNKWVDEICSHMTFAYNIDKQRYEDRMKLKKESMSQEEDRTEVVQTLKEIGIELEDEGYNIFVDDSSNSIFVKCFKIGRVATPYIVGENMPNMPDFSPKEVKETILRMVDYMDKNNYSTKIIANVKNRREDTNGRSLHVFFSSMVNYSRMSTYSKRYDLDTINYIGYLTIEFTKKGLHSKWSNSVSESMNQEEVDLVKSAKIGDILPESDIYMYVQGVHPDYEGSFVDGDLGDRIERFSKYKLSLINIDDIDIEEFDLDEDLVEEYEEMYKSNEDYPAIVIDGSKDVSTMRYKNGKYVTYYTIIDGTHRVNALNNLGVTKIKAWVGIK